VSSRDTIRRALHDAIDWQTSLADAYRHIPNAPEANEAKAQIRLYRQVLNQRYGVALAKKETQP
jgi:trehalose utilization protein